MIPIPSRRLIAKSTILMAIAGAGLSCGHSDHTPNLTHRPETDSLSFPVVHHVEATGRMEPLSGVASLSLNTSGILAQVMVHEGDTVKQGTPLLSLDKAIARTQTEAAQAAVQQVMDQQKSQLLEVKKALFDYRKALQDYQVTRELFRKQAATGDELSRQSQTLLQDSLLWQIALARQSTLESDLAQARAHLQEQLAIQDGKVLKAPSAGTVLKVYLKPGDAVTPGETLCEFSPISPWSVLCEVDQLFAAKISVGQEADIRLEGYASLMAKGHVVMASPILTQKALFSDAPGEKQDRRVREVRILLDSLYQTPLVNQKVQVSIQVQ